MPAWLSYSLLRVGIFLATLVILLVLGLYWLWAALIATVVAFCVSYIFFRRQRLALAEELASRRPVRTSDDAAEDAQLERGSAPRDSAPDGSARDGEGERGAQS